jgi:hypothetical protein
MPQAVNNAILPAFLTPGSHFIFIILMRAGPVWKGLQPCAKKRNAGETLQKE